VSTAEFTIDWGSAEVAARSDERLVLRVNVTVVGMGKNWADTFLRVTKEAPSSGWGDVLLFGQTIEVRDLTQDVSVEELRRFLADAVRVTHERIAEEERRVEEERLAEERRREEREEVARRLTERFRAS
jgi:hypothetical protein